MPRVRALLAGTGTVAAVGALLVAGINGGYPASRPQLRSGAAWLASASVGQLTLLDGATAEIAAQVQVASRGDRVDVVQEAATAYAVNRTTGTIRRVDGATFEGVLTAADPKTLTSRGAPVPLATQISGQAAALDDAGRLWVLDTSSGDVVWIDRGQRHSRRGVAAPGAGLLTIADGNPVVVDTNRRTAIVLDPHDGGTRNTVNLDLRSGDRLRLSGSPHSAQIYLVASRGVLAICALTESTCGSAVPLGAAGNGQLGTPVETGGRLFVPDYGSGKVWIVDLKQPRVIAQPKVLDEMTQFQLLSRDGVVFYNDPNSEQAGVIRLDGGFTAVPKYDPKNPDKGLSGHGAAGLPPESAPGTPPDSPSPPAPSGPTPPPPSDPATQPETQPDTQTQPDEPDRVRITVSRSTALAGEDIALKVEATGRRQPTDARWTFGDGQTATGTTTAHRWNAPQTYQISVKATFANGRSATASLPIQITARRPTLTLSVPGTGGTVSGAGITCPPACSTTTAPGQPVTLTAKPANGFSFGGWSGGCSGTGPTCTVVMNADATVMATFPKGGTPPQQLGTPILLSPANGAVMTNFPRNTTLRWAQVTGAAKYLVEVQCDTCGSTPWTPWLTTTVTATSVSFTWVGDNTGRWRVTAIGPDGTKGPASGFRSFSFKTGPAKLPAPVLTSPANGAVFHNFPRTTTLRWQAVSGARSYQVEVQCDVCGPPGTMWVPWITTTVTGTSYTFDWVGAQSGRWRITAISNSGAMGVPSGFRTFRYTV
ncbi:MAG: hypothetical protein AUG44_26030 [Actinobacteria bacterium 13_1_20CM_3_71_11]|nr:MAG: hypothetical protein AUG44_26030 [Actinobacteria bacterium 13_1_20CM_3_71_11]